MWTCWSERGRPPVARLAGAAAAVAVVAALCVSPAAALSPAAGGVNGAGPREYGCPIFPANNALNEEVANAPVDPRSAQYVASIGLTAHLHPDFGRDPAYGIPYTVVSRTQRKVPIDFTEYAEESEPGPYPVPPNAPVEGAGVEGDRHVLVLQRGTCRLYELYAAQRSGAGWRASNGAVFNLRSNALRPEGWTSADAAGLPILPLLVRYPEVAGGAIDHALRVTVPRTQRGYILPATHFASSSADASLPPMGLRLRLKAAYSLAGFSGQALVIMRALKRYGVIVADNGSPWYITGAPSPSWDEASLEQLKRVPGSAFEAVRSGPIVH
ncbi:MAG TPA: hypothetical protein VGX69_04390 [Solirubrobacteraceae bacterium]|nr:hypothetical protein [Solirubrobacteraceae bacterium]